jgi:hypothetical protein
LADTRAYFTAATGANFLYKSLNVNIPLLFLNSQYLYKNFSYKWVNPDLSLTIWNKPLGFSSMIRKSRISNQERNMLKLTPRARSIIIGLIVSDGWMDKRGHWNPRFGFKQSFKNFPYIWHLYNELAYLCSGNIYLGKNKMRGKILYNLSFQSRQLKSLNEVYNMFYLDSRTKIIKPELFEYLDYLSIAHWIMGDGSKRNKGITLCTDSFSIKDVVTLMNILKIKFNINSTIHMEKLKPRIYINKKELLKILPFIKPYFDDHFLYKIEN